MRAVVAVVALAACQFEHGALGTSDGGPPGHDADGAVDAALASRCDDGIHNGTETDVDCGGSCGPCAVGQACGASGDCLQSVCDAATCRLAYSCGELHTAQAALASAPYTIDPDGAGSGASLTTYCDMAVDGGGWTLIGKVDGRYDMYTQWMLTTVNASDMLTPTIGPGTFACVDASELAVNRSTDIRFSNSAIDRWVKWPLPAGRDIGTFWHHSVGYATINAATQSAVTVTGWDGTTTTCYQNIYGVMNWDQHGGAYPETARNTTGNTTGSDLCMSIG